MRFMKCFFSFFIVLIIFMFAGCSNDFREIPAGHVGKMLTPTGWQNEIREAGQIDIGRTNSNGSYNTLVLLEATSTVVKESFGKVSDGDVEDHRIIISKTPVTVDVYVRMMVPSDPKLRNAIFAQVTPTVIQEKTSMIKVENIYKQFAQMDVRSGVRAILQKETDVYYISSHLDVLNDRLGAMVVKLFEKSGVPLLVQNVTISNIKMDVSIWEAENQKTAALAQVEAITKIGAAIRDNPQYMLFKKYDTYKDLANSGKVGTFTIIEGNPGGVVIK